MTGTVTRPSRAGAAGTAVQEVEAELLVLLTRVRRRAREAARRIDPDLGAVGYAVLHQVHRGGPTRAADLVAGLALDKGLVSRAVGQLERLGLVGRTVDPADARAQVIAMTPQGRRAVEEANEAGRADVQRRLASWPAEDLAQFAEQLHRYNETLGS